MDDYGVDGSVSYPGAFADEYDEELFDPNWTPQVLSPQPVLIPGAPASLAGFTPNQQGEILGEMDDYGVDGSVSYPGDFADEYDEELFDPNWAPQVLSPQPVLISGAPAALAGFTPNQQVEILGEMDDF